MKNNEKYDRRTSKQSVRGSNPCRRATRNTKTYRIFFDKSFSCFYDLFVTFAIFWAAVSCRAK